MPHDAAKYLYDMASGCAFLEHFIQERTSQDLLNDRGFRSAVERELQIIGEALTQLAKYHPTLVEHISEYQRIIAFRHLLVHGYDGIDHEVVWAILQYKLPILAQEVADLLAKSTQH